MNISHKHADRLHFLDIDEDCRAALHEFRPILVREIDAILDDFYGHIAKNSAAAAIFNGASIDHAREMQKKHWTERVFSGSFDEKYMASAEKIGRIHQKFGVGPHFYMAGYCYIINHIGKAATSAFSNQPQKLQKILLAINKAAFLDMEIGMSVYIDAGLEYLERYDPLTDLANRRLLIDRLQQAQTSGSTNSRYGSVLFVDVDNFHKINDALDYATGDLALQEIAKRLSNSVRYTDTVARIGSDDFRVILTDLSREEVEAAATAESIGRSILEAIARPCSIDGREYHLTASIGIAMFLGHETGTGEILRSADLALHHAKSTDKSTIQFFDMKMQDAVKSQVELDENLRNAIKQNEFFLLYQPQVDEFGRLVGAEALVRWRHPRNGLISPAQFIPRAEENGAILPLGSWVLRAGCRQLSAWAAQPETAHLSLAINVSPRQFQQSDFVREVLESIEETGANPERLKLELTEGMLVDDIDAVVQKMTALKRSGIMFSLDDFGTGYSSLNYLNALPLAQLKIDQSFVRNLTTDTSAATIAKTIIGLARNLNLSVIAEGVETEAQRDYLRGSGCDFFQGYLFGRPMPAEDLVGTGIGT